MSIKTLARPMAANTLADPSNVAGGQVKKTEALLGGNAHSERTHAWHWAQSAIALCIGQAMDWSKLAHELFSFTTEQREAAIATWREWKTAKIKARQSQLEAHPSMEDTAFKRVMGTATTRLSHMSTIAKALDAGMDASTLATHYRIEVADVKGLSIDSIYVVAKTFTKAKAGRTVEDLRSALTKWLDKRESDGKIAPSDDDMLKAVRAAIAEWTV